jgi:glutamine synthetase
MVDAPTTAGDLLAALDRDNVEHLWVTYLDYSGRSCAKTIPRGAFRGAVNDGVVFALANLDLDLRDEQAAGSTWLADSGDMMAVPDPRSYIILPRYPGTARVHAWLRGSDGSGWQGCPRTRLQAVVDELREHGFSAQVALEPEFYLLTRDDDGEYQPAISVRSFSETGLAAENVFVRQVVDELTGMGIALAQFGKEFGPGQYEISVRHDSPFAAIDRYCAVKDVVRDAARSSGRVATFMPKVFSHWVGCSLHLHLSLWDAAGERDLTPNPDDEVSLSDVGRWFMGGLLAHVPALTGLGSPTVNSYKRLQPGTFAPANSYWGYGNRSGVIRIPGPGKRRHIEFRSGDNSCQPALFVAGVLAAGFDGIKRQIDPGPPFQGDIGHMTPAEIAAAGICYLPRDLRTALAALAADEVVAGAIGETALAHLLLVKRNELTRYETEVHPWERETFLEVI